MARNHEDYSKAFEGSLDARAIELMVHRYQDTLNTLELSQARVAVGAVMKLIRNGGWLDERDQIDLNDKLGPPGGE